MYNNIGPFYCILNFIVQLYTDGRPLFSLKICEINIYKFYCLCKQEDHFSGNENDPKSTPI